LGKSLLAFLGRGKKNARLLSKLELRRFTEKTICDRDRLEAELERTVCQGYAVDEEEVVQGTRCLGAPIIGRDGTAFGAISVAGPVYRILPSRFQQLGEEVRQVADDIARILRDVENNYLGTRGMPVLMPAQIRPAFYGYSPQWIAKRNLLYWVDTHAPEMNFTNATATTTIAPQVRQPILATIMVMNRMVSITKDFIVSLDEAMEVETHPVGSLAGISGLSADRSGIPYGAMYDQLSGETSVGPLLEDGRMKPAWRVSGFIRSLKWHPNDRQLFAVDPSRGVIYSLEKGTQTARVFSRLSQAAGTPLTTAVDTNGGLWVAMYDGWSIVRIDRFGEIDTTIPLPVPRPTGLAFGGPLATTLMITTAKFGLPRHILENAPLSGRLLQVEIGIKGGLQNKAKYLPGAA